MPFGAIHNLKIIIKHEYPYIHEIIHIFPEISAGNQEKQKEKNPNPQPKNSEGKQMQNVPYRGKRFLYSNSTPCSSTNKSSAFSSVL